MSTLAIVFIVLGVVLLLLFVGGAVARARYSRLHEDEYARHLAAADQALEEARAADRGWDRRLLEEAARRALADQRAELRYESLDLILVDDRPGVSEDRAHFLARGGDDEVRVVLSRREADWVLEHIE